MSRDISESDWCIFREIRPPALERFCERVLAEAQSLATERSKSAHDRYMALYPLFKERDKDLAEAFDIPSRSRAMLQLPILYSRGLVTEDELARFSPMLQDKVRTISGLRTERSRR